MRKSYYKLFENISSSIHWKKNWRVFRDSRKTLLAIAGREYEKENKFEIERKINELNELQAKLEFKSLFQSKNIKNKRPENPSIISKIFKNRKVLSPLKTKK